MPARAGQTQRGDWRRAWLFHGGFDMKYDAMVVADVVVGAVAVSYVIAVAATNGIVVAGIVACEIAMCAALAFVGKFSRAERRVSACALDRLCTDRRKAKTRGVPFRAA